MRPKADCIAATTSSVRASSSPDIGMARRRVNSTWMLPASTPRVISNGLSTTPDPVTLHAFREELQLAFAPAPHTFNVNLVGPVIAVRPYCHNDHYWQVYFDTNEAIVRTCAEAGWPAPTPATKMIQVAG